jgi:nucleoside-diphosphate-sugar epimerase
MDIFIAGATGAIGRSLIPQLIDHGHTVTGTTRSPGKADALRALGAEPVIVDGLDREGLHAAVAAARPDVVVHEMTALSGLADMRKFESAFAQTNRLRTEGTNHLIAAAQAAGVERIVAQSYAGWPAARTGAPVQDETAPFESDPPKQLRAALGAIRHLEQTVLGAGGVVLRYGGFYGPGTGLAPGAEQWEAVRARKFPLVGDGGGVWSFAHIDDAAAATVAAIEDFRPGELFNAVDDDPAPVREWLPALAEAMGAPAPRHVPRWVARLMGEHLVVMMTEVRGASNAKIRRELGWEPKWPTWREGFAALARDPERVAA